jgi:hypothetical protein
VEQELGAIRGARILDIASHDGRWSAACLANGAQHVTGIEAREHLARKAEKQIGRFAGPDQSYRFLAGDVHQLIQSFSPGEFDTILCLGFLYHTPHHFFLFEQFSRLEPRFLIIDTNISRRNGKLIDYHLEDTGPALSAASDQPLTWVGHMTKELLQEALKSFGFEVSFFDWGAFIRELGVPSPGIQVDYAIGTRVTVLAARREKV